MKKDRWTGVFLGTALLAGVAAAFSAHAQEMPPGVHAGCPGYDVKRDFNYNVTFWLWAVGQKEYTLIADTDHADPHMLSVLASEEIIRRWKEEKGVTDISLEITPRMHERIKPYLSPYDRAAVQQEFQKYMEERGLWTHGDWAKIRSGYMADFIGHAQKNGIHFHFVSEDPRISLEDEKMDAIYREMTRIMAASCYDRHAVEGFLGSLDPRTQRDFERYRETMMADRLDDAGRIEMIKKNGHGGRQIILFGARHLSPRERNSMGALLPPESRAIVEIYPNRSMVEQDYGANFLYFYDKGSWVRAWGGPR